MTHDPARLRGGAREPHVLPAARRPGYDRAVTTRLADRSALAALARGFDGRAGEPDTPLIPAPALGTPVVFQLRPGARVWKVGIVETVGHAGIRVAYLDARDLRLAEVDDTLAPIRRARPHRFREVPVNTDAHADRAADAAVYARQEQRRGRDGGTPRPDRTAAVRGVTGGGLPGLGRQP